MPLPPHVRVPRGETSAAAELERQSIATQVQQQYYNQNRVALGRAINRTVDVLAELQRVNATWPAHYPSVQRPAAGEKAHEDPDRHAGGVEVPQWAPSHVRTAALERIARLKQADEEAIQAESSRDAEQASTAEPRLITPQIAQDFSVLKIDLKLDGLSQAQLVHSLEKHSIASLLDGQISHSVKHLLALRDRIDDSASKVLVTGDLNAGKSTFCNALIRRKVLPEDQQPCTGIFCEVLDARENEGKEEVHAVHKEVQYNRLDEGTYDVYQFEELEMVVWDSERYTQAKVYVLDARTNDESLLNNGVVDISIIDAPGLNRDMVRTTAVFARQEEIDVVVFVVSAANHFTLSAREFLWNAAREKAYIFIVVNGYDAIDDQEKCQRKILEQVAKLSPRTFKESTELVHFVSSNAIPIPSAGIGASGPPGGGGSGGPGGDPDEGPTGKGGEEGASPKKDKGKGKQKDVEQDFERLEQALRRFVLEKRARSKLAPAKTYLTNLLGDVGTLATVNRDVAEAEVQRVSKELADLQPVYEQSLKSRSDVSGEIDLIIDDTCAEIYSHTRASLSGTISRVAEADLGVAYPGVLGAFRYAEDVKLAMLDQVSAAVTECEMKAREGTVQAVEHVKDLGYQHIGDEYTEASFRPENMFRRKRDALVRQVDAPVGFQDLFDVTGAWQRQDKVAGTSMAVTAVGLVGGRMVGGMGWVDGAMGAAKVIGYRGLRRLIVPGLLVAAIAATTYLVLSIPKTLPRRLSAKLAASLAAVDYTHANATRISTEVGKVIRIPADTLRVGLQRSVEKVIRRREDTLKLHEESKGAQKYFTNLVKEADECLSDVDAVDVEGNPPGVAGGYES
ncbi:MAG: mitofusin [Thelocarpon impressellum]|nr:MAG: mitofusin [Thelocarpon impressellum]